MTFDLDLGMLFYLYTI